MTDKTQQQLTKIILPLISIGIVCALVLTIVNHLTHEKIADNARRYQLPVLDVLMPLEFDNDMFNDVIEVNDPGLLGTENNVSIFRARKNNAPVGLVILPIVTKGYSGKIEQKETEGLGDKIDRNKSDWITQFTARSLTDPTVDAWAVKNEGGYFDQLSGATITSRSAINAIRKVLEFYEKNKDRLYLK